MAIHASNDDGIDDCPYKSSRLSSLMSFNQLVVIV